MFDNLSLMDQNPTHPSSSNRLHVHGVHGIENFPPAAAEWVQFTNKDPSIMPAPNVISKHEDNRLAAEPAKMGPEICGIKMSVGQAPSSIGYPISGAR